MKASPWFVLFPAVLIFSVPARTQSTMRTSTPRPPSTLTRPDSIQDSGLYGYWSNMTGQGRAGGVLLGKVTVEGEHLLWNPILVSVICNGTTMYTTQTDPSGNFGIVSVTVKGDVSLQGDSQRQMEVHYEGCTVQASFAGFHSSVVTITQRNLRDDPDLGTITLSRAGGRAAGTAVSRTIESAPTAAVKAFEKARTELLDQKPDRAQRDLQKAVQAYPSFAEAWYQLGMLQQASSSREAQNAFSKAVAADPQFVLPYEQLAAEAAQNQRWQEVVDDTSRALKLDPAGTARTWALNALGNFQLGKTDMAVDSAFKSLIMDPEHTVPGTEQLLAVILGRKGDYPGALVHLNNCLTYLPSGPGADLVKGQITQLEGKVRASKAASPVSGTPN